jgi:hypothetical protein
VRIVDEQDADGKRMLEIQVDGPLSTAEAGLLAIMIQEAGRVEGERWSREECRKSRKK